MGIKQLYNDNLRKLPNEYGDVSIVLMAIKTNLTAIRFADLESMLILSVTVRHFKHFSRSNVNILYKDRCTIFIQL